jgi:dUTP pyrophosphatase
MAPIKSFKTKMSKVRVINRSPFPLPKYQSDHAAGLDLQAVLEVPIILEPLQRELIKTGIFLALPEGTEAQVRPRSGLAYKKGLTVLNSPGTIDADYRGEVGVILVNLSNEPVKIEPGERIAQLVLARYERIDWEAVEALDDTARGSGGFGSTGV